MDCRAHRHRSAAMTLTRASPICPFPPRSGATDRKECRRPPCLPEDGAAPSATSLPQRFPARPFVRSARAAGRPVPRRQGETARSGPIVAASAPVATNRRSPHSRRSAARPGARPSCPNTPRGRPASRRRQEESARAGADTAPSAPVPRRCVIRPIAGDAPRRGPPRPFVRIARAARRRAARCQQGAARTGPATTSPAPQSPRSAARFIDGEAPRRRSPRPFVRIAPAAHQ
jgi:hypothetical protein